MLKHIDNIFAIFLAFPAAFRRLCVETMRYNCYLKISFQPPSGGCVLKHAFDSNTNATNNPAAFRRLCVETVASCLLPSLSAQPPSGGCVLKLEFPERGDGAWVPSRLQAAVC